MLLKSLLNYRPNGTFYEHWQQNSTWEILFTAVNDQSVAFAALNNEASIFWQGQEFIVKQCVSDYNGGLITKEITASHVMYECSRFRQHSIKSGTLTYAVNDVLAFIFKYIFTLVIAPITVGIVIKLFAYWLDKHNNNQK